MVGVTVTAVLVTGLTAGTAAAVPSDSEIAAARAAVDAVAARAGQLSEQLATAQAAAESAHAASVMALDEYQATEAAYQGARGEADAAASVAVQVTAELAVARTAVVAFARRSYMEGSTYAGAAALVAADDPAELIERAALLEAAGARRSDVLTEVTALQQEATEADAVARTALTRAEVLQEQSAAALSLAQAAEVSAREHASMVADQQTQLETDLAQAQEELSALVGDREAAARLAQQRAAAQPAPAPRPTQTPAPGPVPTGTGSSTAAATAVDAAMRYLGTPYAWGGGGTRGPGYGIPPDATVFGFDCSGLSQYAYAQAGIAIPRNSRAQYAALPKVAADDLQAGDLVFWATDPGDPTTIYHLGIYLGNDRVVHAPQSGDVVKVSTMWWRGYAGAVRPSA